MADDKAFNEICEGIWRLRMAFEKHHLTPGIIELAEPEHGCRLKSLIPLSASMFSIGMDDKGEAVHQVEIQGVIVRWPAQRRARNDGGFDYV